MIRFTYIDDYEVVEGYQGISKVVIEAREEGQMDDYVEGFGAFLKACGFHPDRVHEVLPTLER